MIDYARVLIPSAIVSESLSPPVGGRSATMTGCDRGEWTAHNSARPVAVLSVAKAVVVRSLIPAYCSCRSASARLSAL